MLSKEELRRKFSKDYSRVYEVALFRERGFVRKTCSICKRPFWTLNPDRDICADASCVGYRFIGNAPTKVRLDYVKAWHKFREFFEKEGHTTVPRYPVVARWRQDLYFTVASIVDFQPYVVQGIVEPPANPLIIAQPCLRFKDIENVGLSGRHFTSFVMIGQHAFNSEKWRAYWKDRTIELNFRFLTEVLGIPEEEVVYMEDVWIGGGNFGPSIESMVLGLEIVNSVFMQYKVTAHGYEELKTRVIDVGWGHERLPWITQGSSTAYDVVFPKTIQWMLKTADLKVDQRILLEYWKLAGALNVDESDVNLEKKRIAKRLGLSMSELNSLVKPMQAVYAIADHARTLAFAITDGAIPSNVGGGYNLRVVLRRAQDFIDYFDWDFSLDEVCIKVAEEMKPLFPELIGAKDAIEEIVRHEVEKYRESRRKARRIVERVVERGFVEKNEMKKLYESFGITPEMVERVARELGKSVRVELGFYEELTREHMGEKEEEKEIKVDVEGLEKTELLYYKDPYLRKVKAKVLRVGKGFVILDRTIFYPEGGGQPGDRGTISGLKVLDTKKKEGIVIHFLESAEGLKEGEEVEIEIDWERRHRLMCMHTATHLLLESARRVLGSHVWQCGSELGTEVSRLDITHFRKIRKSELREIERIANMLLRKNVEVRTFFMPRNKAEQKYGFKLYQGGAVPGRDIRIVEIPGIDVEACGGTHVRNTGEIGLIKIVKEERIQDGVSRLIFSAGEAALERVWELEDEMSEIREVLKGEVKGLGKRVKKLFEEWKEEKKRREKAERSLAREMAKGMLEKSMKVKGRKVVVAQVEGLGMLIAQEIANLDKEAIAVIKEGEKVFIASLSGVEPIVEALKKRGQKVGGKGRFGSGLCRLSLEAIQSLVRDSL